MWFHEACKEASPLFATLKFAASMDSLASGRKVVGILTLFDNVVGWKRDHPILRDGTTLESLIKKIYGQGRSRTIHGSNNQAGLDWSRYAALSEFLAKQLLIGCVDWAAETDTTSDIAVLVATRSKA